MSKISTPPAKSLRTRSSTRIIIPNTVCTHVALSPTVLIEESPFPPQTCKGKEKKGESVWTDLAMRIGRAHNVFSDEELKALSLVSSHELISHRIHKLVQVKGFLLNSCILLFLPFALGVISFYRFLRSPCT